MKDMRVKKAEGDENVPVDIIKMLGEDGHKLTTQLVKNVCETGECPSDFVEVRVIALKKNLEAATVA